MQILSQIVLCLIHIVDSLFTTRNVWNENINIEGTPVCLKLDTGSQANVLTSDIYKCLKNQPKLKSTDTKVISYTGQQVPIIGECILKCEVRNKTVHLKFLVSDLNSPPVLGLQACTQLGLIAKIETIQNQPSNMGKTTEEVLEEYADVFEGLGELPGEHTIHLKEGASPRIQAARRIPQALMQPVKDELDRMEQLGIIQKITEPTEWVHPMVVVRKQSGAVRICIDPRELNPWIKREHYQLPAPETVLAQIPSASCYTVLDARSAFWQVKVDEESAKLLTMATPFGRYIFHRLPFGVCSAPEVLQQKMHSMYQGVNSTITFMDDVLTSGVSDSDHNRNLITVLDIARKNNLKFEKTKLQLKKKKVKFVGHDISAEGITLNPSRVQAIRAIPPPTDKKGLQRFIGTITYVSRFIPQLSEKTVYLRQLMKKNSQFIWDETAQSHFEDLKGLATNAPVLQHFNPGKPILLSVDASQHGLGAVLIQEGHPIAYASATQTDTQRRYAQIEKELLALYYGCNRFHYYLYGRHFKAQTDHKPLLAIMKKQLNDISPRLQRLVMKLQRYNFELEYIPGKNLVTADTLSRDSPSCETVDTADVDSCIYVMEISVKATPQRLREIEKSTASDPEMQQLAYLLQDGWPENRKQVPAEIRSYWPFRHELHMCNGLMCRGNRLVIPRDHRKLALEKLHSSHQGIVSTKNLARETMFWPGMSAQIQDMISCCPTCQESQRSNIKEPLLSYPVPDRPWQSVAMDFCYLDGDQYLIVIDYFSKYPEVLKVSSTSANQIIPLLKSVFARHGIPEEIVSDNGPPFSSSEFKKFLNEWEIQHKPSSPHHPSSNGQVERTVQSVKALLKKAKKDGKDPYLSLLSLRNTPGNNIPSPSQLLMGRRLRTQIPVLNSLLESKNNIDMDSIKHQLLENQKKQKYHFDKKAKSLSVFMPGQPVNMQTKDGWKTAKILHGNGRSYVLETSNGSIYRRNRIHLRPRNYGEKKNTQLLPPVHTPPDNQEAVMTSTYEKQFSTQDPGCVTGTSDSSANQELSEPIQYVTRSGRVIRPPTRYLE